MKKQLMAILLAGAMCAGSMMGVSAEEAETGAVSVEDAAEVLGEVSFVIGLRDEFRSVLEAGMLDAADDLGIKLSTQDAKQDSSMMLQYVETAKNSGQKAIIVNMVDTATAAQIVEAAGDMKVVFVNMPPNDLSVLNENVAYVGSDETTAGYFQGEFLANYFKEQGKTDIKYILLSGTLGATYTLQRTESVLQALEENGINAEEATEPLVADYERATAMDMIAPLLTAQTEFDCIIANNDAMAIGAIEALRQADIDPTTVPVVGIDATVDGCAEVQSGALAMTVYQDGYGQGYGALMAAYNLVAGNELSTNTGYETDETGCILWVPFEPVTAENVEDYIQ